MNTNNPLHVRFVLSLFTLLALACAACGAAPGDGTVMTEDAPASAASSDTTDMPAERREDAGTEDPKVAAPVPHGNGVPVTRPAGGYRMFRAPNAP